MISLSTQTCFLEICANPWTRNVGNERIKRERENLIYDVILRFMKFLQISVGEKIAERNFY